VVFLEILDGKAFFGLFLPKFLMEKPGVVVGFWGESKLFTCVKTSLAALASISGWSIVQETCRNVYQCL
jgi:hypothetical protein